jgi:DNA-binding transcriptional regulator YdaS (Cro superfamily)
MTVIDVVAIVSGENDLDERYDYSRLPQEIRVQAMTAEGTVVQGLGSAVQRVIEAGQVLSWAKATLPHGEYLPWVQRACRLKPRYAQKLVQAAEWANAPSMAHLENASLEALFLLSADTTPEDVRGWFMERAAAGDVPTLDEVAERKRQAAGKPPAPRPVELRALALVRKAQLSDAEAALSLARSITTVNEAQVREEIGLRELPKGKVLNGNAADFHRRPDGINWDRIPHAGRVDVAQVVAVEKTPSGDEQFTLSGGLETLSCDAAAQLLGVKPSTLQQMVVPSRNPNGFTRNGYIATRAGRGMFNVKPIP